jgi:hypothetical protein
MAVRGCHSRRLRLLGAHVVDGYACFDSFDVLQEEKELYYANINVVKLWWGATSCRCHDFNARLSRWHWRGHLVQRSVEVKDGAQRVYVLPHDFAGLSNL